MKHSWARNGRLLQWNRECEQSIHVPRGLDLGEKSWPRPETPRPTPYHPKPRPLSGVLEDSRGQGQASGTTRLLLDFTLRFAYGSVIIVVADESVFLMLDYFLPRCMECRRGLAMRILSVCQTRALWQNGRKIYPDFLYHTKEHHI